MPVPQLSMSESGLYQRRQHHQPPLPPLPEQRRLTGGSGDQTGDYGDQTGDYRDQTGDYGDQTGDYAQLEPRQHAVTTTRMSEMPRTAGLPPPGPSAVAVRKYGQRSGRGGVLGHASGWISDE